MVRGPGRQPARLGVDAHVLDGKYQGSRTWLLEIMRRVPALLPDVTLVLYSADPAKTAQLVAADGIEYRAIGRGPSAVRISAFWPWAITRDRLDLLLTQYICPLTHAARQLVVVHDVLFMTHPGFFPPMARFRNQLLVRHSTRRARRVITVSSYSAEQIARVFGVEARRLAIVRNGVDLTGPRWPSLGDPDPTVHPARLPDHLAAQLAGAPFVLFVGRLEPRKNLRLALDALRLTRSQGWLVVVGRDDFEHPQTLARLAAEHRAIHLMDVPPAQLQALYRAAAALVFPSLGEGWGIPVVEALAAGTAVIASDRTAVPEAAGPAAHYFDPGAPTAPEDLAALMDRAFAGDLPLDLAAARAHLSGLDWDTCAAAFADTVRGVLAEDRSPAPVVG